MQPVLIESVNGRYEATLFGAPGFRADGETKEEAVAALQRELALRATKGEVVWVDMPKIGVTDLVGRYGYDPFLDEIVAEAYRQRDEEKAREFPE